MDSISPLAKILAEANGIDWRSIQGSGAGGSIVEQDILNYLSRVMSGDEDPPATPVDETPAGWTGEMPPMPASVAASGLQALSAAGVESDITDFVAQQSVQAAPAQAVQAPVVQPPPAQAQTAQVQALAEPQAPQPLTQSPLPQAPLMAPMPEVPTVAVYRPAEPPTPPVIDTPAATTSDVVTPTVTPPAVALPAPEPSVAEFELGPDGDVESDLEFELDDDLPEDDSPVNGLPVGSLSAPLQPAPVVEPVAVSFQAPTPVQETPEPAVERPAYDPVAFDSEAEFLLADAPPVPKPSSATPASEAMSAVPMPVPADAIGAQVTASEATPVSGATPVPVSSPVPEMAPAPETSDRSQDSAPVQAAVAEAAAVTTGFGLGGFLSRLYGSGAAAAPEPAPPVQPVVPEVPVPVNEVPAAPLQAAPVPVESVRVTPPSAEPAPEVIIGRAHPEPYMPSFDPAPGALGSPLLGEALVSQAPPIPDTPVAGPLVADQWRDQPAATEDTSQRDAGHAAQGDPKHDPFLLGAPVAEHEPVSAAPDQTAPDHTALGAPVDLGQPIALPEAHEGGLDPAHAEAVHAEVAQSESVQAAPVKPAPVYIEPLQPESVAQNWTALVEPQAEQVERPADAVSLPAVDVQPLRSQPSGAQAITLRLNVDLAVLEAARAQLSEALYREVPLSLLVARAAARSLVSLGLGTSGGVALADHAGQPLAADLSGDFRASLDGLGQPAQTPPALLVLDAAELGLDELHRGECSLSVGRAGGGASALSLRGDLDPGRGAKFLHEVAGLLDTPILLLF
ncbi:E3 binding domain-containing protein [Deinococcus radiomollis]|uniref:E3 binding domain-containing protein n=1 Tax=Deinococcus radiomollis TaxID=468916 RepID=UPI003891D822